jgi:hypothetical protein
VAAGTRSASVFLLIHEARLAGKRFLHKGVRGRKMKLKIVTFIAAAWLLFAALPTRSRRPAILQHTGGTSAPLVEDFQVNVGDRGLRLRQL